MASLHEVKEIESCKISPPQGSVPTTTLPLTFFDIPWLLFSPNEPLFFYEFPHSTHYFTQTILQTLKHSLSLTLQHFFPLAGKLVIPPEPSTPYLIYNAGDSVSLTLVESTGDFDSFSGYHPRNAHDFHELVPSLVQENGPREHEKCTLLAVQITVFPKQGFCMGFALRQVAADGRTFDNFLKTWASICKNEQRKYDNFPKLDKISCYYNRDVVLDKSGFEPIFMEQWWNLQKEKKERNYGKNLDGIMRATFVVGPLEMEKIKSWILTRSVKLFGSSMLHLSPYVLTCAFVWVCWIKTHFIPVEDFLEVPHYFGFIAGAIHRLEYSVSSSYIGNCVVFGRPMARRNELIGEDGTAYAAKAIGDTMMELNNEVLGKAENWILDWNEIFGSELHVMITGSPKVRLYGLDFGWGKPIKVEEISIDTTRAISLSESRDIIGGIEVGLALPKLKMDAFCRVFHKGL